MNMEQINNGDIRIFPFYNGKYMGVMPLGFSSKSSAQKYMQNIPSEDIYDSIGGFEKYEYENSYLYGIDKHNLLEFSNGNWYKREFVEGCYDYDYSEKVYLKDLPDADEIKKLVSKINDYHDIKYSDDIKSFEEKYGLFPSLWLDETKYKKAKSKFIKENVQYRQGIVHIDVEYLD